MNPSLIMLIIGLVSIAAGVLLERNTNDEDTKKSCICVAMLGILTILIAGVNFIFSQ